jgi:Integrase core domain
MAPAADCAQVDVHQKANEPLRRPRRHPATCGATRASWEQRRIRTKRSCDRSCGRSRWRCGNIWRADLRSGCEVAVCERLSEAGIRVVPTPYHAPNANAYAERFVRSIKEECLDRMIPLGEWHFRRAVTEFVEHDHRESNHQGLENALIDGGPTTSRGRVHRQPRLGGLLNYCSRAA